MDTDERRAVFEQYGGNGNRKSYWTLAAVFVALVVVAGLIGYYYFRSSTDFVPEKTVAVLEDVVFPGIHNIQTNLPENQCYWIRPTTDADGFVLEIRTYNSSSRNCIGDLVNKTIIRTENPPNIIGNDCICGRKICEMENVFEYNRTDLKMRGCV